MWRTGEQITAVVVAFCALVAPAAFVMFMLTVLLAARRPPAPPWVGELLRWAEAMQPWSMVEVMMLGVLVALVKIAELATVEPGIGMFAIFGLMVLFPVDRLELRRGRDLATHRLGRRRASARAVGAARGDAVIREPVTGAAAGLVCCETCASS